MDPVSAVRLPANLTRQVDTWGEQHALSRSEAIRRLVELGLTVKTKGRPTREGQKFRAREMASNTIDKLSDTTASSNDQASRKRRLIKGPEEFQNVRRDRNEKP